MYGISYTEFSYILLQSLDYRELFRTRNCTLQTGASDQWGNISSGVELIRRSDGGKAHALCTPLLTKADGTKFGKTESGTIWLDPTMTSPYAFHQFFLNAEEAKVVDHKGQESRHINGITATGSSFARLLIAGTPADMGIDRPRTPRSNAGELPHQLG